MLSFSKGLTRRGEEEEEEEEVCWFIGTLPRTLLLDYIVLLLPCERCNGGKGEMKLPSYCMSIRHTRALVLFGQSGVSLSSIAAIGGFHVYRLKKVIAVLRRPPLYRGTYRG